eukprot:gb/GFBE01056311.1/.p1 GENE.gb/GFBE01056311.1/~~gb/GFBE01056311.1/.p1  ORF type:complete len:389 (+),score=98.15 gb/GFBE01056311.1/:1-1167(+)
MYGSGPFGGAGLRLGGGGGGGGGPGSDDDVETAYTDDEGGRRGGGSISCPDSLEDPKCLVAAGCGCCTFIVLLCMLLASFAGLHATKFAIVRNKVTGVVNFGSTYQGGRNLIGFWNDYLEFPATIQSIEWLPGAPIDSKTRDLSPMSVRTADGLMVELGVVAQYRVVKDKIPDIYQTYKTDYEAFFISNLRSALQGIISTYKATELYTNRDEVDQSLYTTCQQVCEQNLKGYLSCWGIQLMEVNLDERIETANIRQQVEMQKQATENMKQKASLIRAKTQVLESDFDRQVKLVNVEADASAVNITKKAASDAEYNMAQARAEALNIIQNTVKNGFMPLSKLEILKYLESNALIDSSQGALVYGDFQSATIFAKSDASAPAGARGLQEL